MCYWSHSHILASFGDWDGQIHRDTTPKYEDQRCLGLYLLELQRHRDSLLRRHGVWQSQRPITDFFGSGKPGEQPPTQSCARIHTRGTLIDRAIELGRSRRQRPRHRSTLHRRRLQQRIRDILARHPECHWGLTLLWHYSLFISFLHSVLLYFGIQTLY